MKNINKIQFICYSKKQNGINMPTSADVRCYSFSHHLNDLGLDTQVINFNRFERGPKILGKLSILISGFFYVLRQHKDTVFYLQKPGLTGLTLRLGCIFKKNKIILDIDDMEFASMTSKMLLKSIIKRSEFIICANDYLRKIISKNTKKKIYVIPGGIETDEIRPLSRKPSRKFRLLWAGNINEQASENLIEILKIYQDVKKTEPEIILDIRGDGSHLSRITEYIKNNNISDVKIVGRQKDFSRYLSNIDLGLVYLFDNEYDNSKNPGKTYTYLAAALPIIGNDVGDNKTTIINGYNGYKVKNNKEFVDKIIFLHKNKDLLRNFGANSRKLVLQKFDRKSIVLKLSKILRDELK